MSSEITDATALSFSNDQIRPLADALAQLHKRAKEVVFLWQAKGIGNLIPNDSGAVLMDSANAGVNGGPDGRTVIHGADINALIGIAAGFYQGNEANNNSIILQIGKIAVNP